MKHWHKSKEPSFGQTIIEWRRRDIERLIGKIFFSWLFAGFFFGILASIFFIAIGLADIAQKAARVVFFGVWIGGAIDSWFRCVVKGISYQITTQGVVHIHPYFGWEESCPPPKRRFFKPTYYFVPWAEVKEIKDHKKSGFVLHFEHRDHQHIPVTPTVKVCMDVKTHFSDVKSKNRSDRNEPKMDKDLNRMILKAAREAFKAAQN